MNNHVKDLDTTCLDQHTYGNVQTIPQIQNSVLEDTETELSRLLQQDDLLTHYEGGILPEDDTLTGISFILDAACGSGGWAVEAAKQLPHAKITGIDGRKRMVDHAKGRALRLGFSNLQFAQMDITTTMEFPDNSFDLVNARCIQGILKRDTWPVFMDECRRILRPGGTLRLTERVFVESNSMKFNQIIALLHRAMHENSRGFAPDIHSTGIGFMLAPLLRGHHFQNIHSRGWTIDFSADTEETPELAQLIRVTYSPYVIGTFLVKMGITTTAEYEHLFDQAMTSLVSPGFRGLSYFLTVTGECDKEK